MAIRDTFNVIAPGLATDANADTMLELAAGQLNPLVFGNQLELAVCYLAAHLLTLARRSEQGGLGAGGTGPITSERAGEVSRQYGQMSIGASHDLSYYNSTPFGMEFLRLRRGRAGTRMFTTASGFFTLLPR